MGLRFVSIQEYVVLRIMKSASFFLAQAACTYAPAVIAGQDFSLQMGSPELRSGSWTIFSIPLRLRFCSTTVQMSVNSRSGAITIHRTLMSHPLALFNEVGFGG